MQTHQEHTTGTGTTLISLAKMVQDQKDEIETYQALLKLPEDMK